MTLQELRYLVALADHRHFGRAADACHVSQPTLSTQIRKLEDYLGLVLCERDSKSVHITPAGEEVVARARRVLAEAEGIRDFARRRTAPLSGPLVLGIIPTLSPYMLPWLVPALEQAYPGARLIVHEDLTGDLVARLGRHAIDAAVVALPITDSRFESLALFYEPFLFACPPDHLLAARKSVREADLGRERLLLLTDGHCLRDQALAVCGLGSTDTGDFRAASLETIRQMVAAGMGCTLMPAMAVDETDGPRIAHRPLAGGSARRIGLIWRKNYPKADDLYRVAEVIRATMPATVKLVND